MAKETVTHETEGDVALIAKQKSTLRANQEK